MTSPDHDLRGKTFLVTGANSGIGRETVRGLAARGATVFLAGRSEERTRPVMEDLQRETGENQLEFLTLDLGDLESVRACAQAFLERDQPLHGLINNAGLAGQRGLTASGFELAFGTNHVGPFLLTSLLLDRLRQSAPARIVIVASDAHKSAKGIDYEAARQPTQTRSALREYGVSKLANVLHAQELARRLEGTGVTTYSLHPGAVASEIWREVPWPIRPLIKVFMRSPEDGAKTSLYCATSSELAQDTGHYYANSQRKEPSKVATPELGRQLWERSEAWTSGDGAG